MIVKTADSVLLCRTCTSTRTRTAQRIFQDLHRPCRCHSMRNQNLILLLVRIEVASSVCSSHRRMNRHFARAVWGESKTELFFTFTCSHSFGVQTLDSQNLNLCRGANITICSNSWERSCPLSAIEWARPIVDFWLLFANASNVWARHPKCSIVNSSNWVKRLSLQWSLQSRTVDPQFHRFSIERHPAYDWLNSDVRFGCEFQIWLFIVLQSNFN